MYIYLKARHFENTEYTDNKKCAISKALKELTNKSIKTYPAHVTIDNGREFPFSLEYGAGLFYDDKYKSGLKEFKTKTIRKIYILGLTKKDL